MKFSTQGLTKAGLDLTPPFSVEVILDPTLEDRQRLAEQHRTLTFRSISRILPGRRLSGVAEVDKTTVYFAKIFYGEGARRYWQRELTGAQRLQRAQVTTPSVLLRGSSADNLGYVVLYQLLPGAENLREDDGPGISQAVAILAGLHEVNCMQTDVHLNNFVVSQGVVYAVDADGIRPGHLLRQQFANLAMLLAQRSPWYDVEVPQIWQDYAAQRGEYVSKMGSAEQLMHLTQLQRARRVRRYLNKTMRECTEFVHRKSWRHNWLCERRRWPVLQRFMLFPEEYVSAGTPLKLGNSSTVVRVDIEGEGYIVKRYNIKGLGHRLRRWVKRRGRNAWRNGHWLDFLGIPTAKPVALLERQWGWFTGVCYLVMPDVGEHHLGELLALKDAPHSSRFAELAPQALTILEHLRAAGLQHGDTKATNFVVHDQRLALIDYDGLRLGGAETDRQRFLRNWEAQPELYQAWKSLLERGKTATGNRMSEI